MREGGREGGGVEVCVGGGGGSVGCVCVEAGVITLVVVCSCIRLESKLEVISTNDKATLVLVSQNMMCSPTLSVSLATLGAVL